MTRKQYRKLLKSQQGELDAVIMYNRLADTVKEKKDADTFRQLASEEGRHASVFRKYTKKNRKPKNTKAVLLVLLYRLIGRKRLYPLIALGEYNAVKTYKPLIKDFPEVKSVRRDEKRHGDLVKGMLD